MSRVRQARRCRARRTDGAACRAWAILGGEVCRVHGGSAPQVRQAAYVALFEAWARRAFAHQMERERRARIAWMARRVALASAFLGVPVAEIHMGHLWYAEGALGIKGGGDPPMVAQDRRFRCPQPPAVRQPPQKPGYDESAGGAC